MTTKELRELAEKIEAVRDALTEKGCIVHSIGTGKDEGWGEVRVSLTIDGWHVNAYGYHRDTLQEIVDEIMEEVETEIEEARRCPRCG